MGRFASIAAVSCLLAACAGGESRTAGPSIPEAGSPGAQAFASRCSLCHAAPHPARHEYSGWLYLVPLMEQRMAERGVNALSEQERALILAYLKEHSR
jgi:mono/diheme cytochrome c family protein